MISLTIQWCRFLLHYTTSSFDFLCNVGTRRCISVSTRLCIRSSAVHKPGLALWLGVIEQCQCLNSALLFTEKQKQTPVWDAGHLASCCSQGAASLLFANRESAGFLEPIQKQHQPWRKSHPSVFSAQLLLKWCSLMQTSSWTVSLLQHWEDESIPNASTVLFSGQQRFHTLKTSSEH